MSSIHTYEMMNMRQLCTLQEKRDLHSTEQLMQLQRKHKKEIQTNDLCDPGDPGDPEV